MRAMSRRARPAGATAVIVAIVLAVLCGFLALALNAGHLFSVRGELQSAADAGALAGAQELDGTIARVSTARDEAEDFAKRHETDSHVDVVIDPASDIQLGYWGDGGGRIPRGFYPMTGTQLTNAQNAACLRLVDGAGNPTCINAVRVTTRRDASHSGEVSNFAGALLGRASSAVGARATAVTGGPCSAPCLEMPMAISNCAFLTPINCTTGMQFLLRWNPDKGDTAGWTTLDEQHSDTPSNGVNYVRDLIIALAGSTEPICAEEDKEAGNLIRLINGTATSACDEMQSLITKRNTFVIPVIDHMDNCSDPKFNQERTVVGFAQLVIDAVYCEDQHAGCPEKKHHLHGHITCEEVTWGGEYGCGFFGISPETPRLVE